MKKIGADECDVTFVLAFSLITLVTISLPVLFCFLQFLFFVIIQLKRGIQIDENLTYGY